MRIKRVISASTLLALVLPLAACTQGILGPGSGAQDTSPPRPDSNAVTTQAIQNIAVNETVKANLSGGDTDWWNVWDASSGQILNIQLSGSGFGLCTWISNNFTCHDSNEVSVTAGSGTWVRVQANWYTNGEYTLSVRAGSDRGGNNPVNYSKLEKRYSRLAKALSTYEKPFQKTLIGDRADEFVDEMTRRMNQLSIDLIRGSVSTGTWDQLANLVKGTKGAFSILSDTWEAYSKTHYVSRFSSMTVGNDFLKKQYRKLSIDYTRSNALYAVFRKGGSALDALLSDVRNEASQNTIRESLNRVENTFGPISNIMALSSFVTTAGTTKEQEKALNNAVETYGDISSIIRELAQKDRQDLE